MFEFIKSLFSSNKPQSVPENLKLFTQLFDSGDFTEALFFLKKHKMLPTDKILKTVNPHFSEYWGNAKTTKDGEVEKIQPQTVAKFYVSPAYRTDNHFIIPSYVSHFIINSLSDTLMHRHWLGCEKDVIIKNNSATTVHFFVRMLSQLIECDFHYLQVDAVDIFYIWLDEFSFQATKWLAEHQSDDLKKLPNKRLVFSTYQKRDFQQFVDNLQFIGYNVEILDGFTSPDDFYNKMTNEIK